MTSRRKAVAALGACFLVAPRTGIAQAGRERRVGWVSLAASQGPNPFLDAFRRGMKERGYTEGRDVLIVPALADGSRERADRMVEELVRQKIDVIVAQGAAVYSAVRAGGSTPVVMGFSGDPVEAKFVASLSRPGGTRTGMSFLALELVGKRLEVLAPLLPAGARVAVVADPQHPGEQSELSWSRRAAQELGLRLDYFPVSRLPDLENAFARMVADGTQAIVVFPDAFTLAQRERLAAFGLKQRLPTVSGWGLFADSGFLMAYGPDLDVSYAHLATFVDRILRGAKPADLPVEFPSTVEFVVNATTAQAIGARLPPSLLACANRVV